MELVAAAKMRRAATAVVKTRPYAQLSWETIRAVAAATGEAIRHPLLERKEGATRTLLVLFSSDRGLAGGYNVNMLKTALAALKQLPAGSVDVVAIGKRGGDALARAGYPVIASFPGLAESPQFKDIIPIGRMIIERFTAGEYKTVLLGYTDYVSGITQRPNMTTLLPMTVDGAHDVGREFTFEPSPQKVLDRALPGLIETMVFQALLEAAASEHAARMMAMRNASDSATEMLEDLTFTYNQARQAAITQEIAEISSGKAALEK